MTDLILYTTDDGKSRIQLRADEQTVWLTQLEMADLFDATKQNISLHLKNLFEDGELDASSVVKESLTTAADGKRYQTLLYNLDAILAVGYRVRSSRGVQFRRWASTVLKAPRLGQISKSPKATKAGPIISRKCPSLLKKPARPVIGFVCWLLQTSFPKVTSPHTAPRRTQPNRRDTDHHRKEAQKRIIFSLLISHF